MLPTTDAQESEVDRCYEDLQHLPELRPKLMCHLLRAILSTFCLITHLTLQEPSEKVVAILPILFMEKLKHKVNGSRSYTQKGAELRFDFRKSLNWAILLLKFPIIFSTFLNILFLK